MAWFNEIVGSLLETLAKQATDKSLDGGGKLVAMAITTAIAAVLFALFFMLDSFLCWIILYGAFQLKVTTLGPSLSSVWALQAAIYAVSHFVNQTRRKK